MPGDENRGTVLVVEPDKAFSRLLVGMLADLGFTVEAVRSGREAAGLVETNTYDGVVTELSLPEVDGYALLEMLRRRSGRAQTQVVVVSAFVHLRNVALARRVELGIDAVLARHGSPDALVRALAGLARGARDGLPHGPVIPWAEHARAPADEDARVAAVHAAGVDDPAEDTELAHLVAEVAQAFGVGSAMVNLVLADRQWTRAAHGLGARTLSRRGTSLEVSFCRHVVEADVPRPLVVPDATSHPVFRDNPLVLAGDLRGYVGAPLLTSAGHVLGTLCLVDREVMRMGPADVDRLVLAARHVSGVLELRQAAVRNRDLSVALQDAEAETARSAVAWSTLLDHLDSGVMLMGGPARTILYANPALCASFSMQPREVVGLTRGQFLDAASGLAADPAAFRDALSAPDLGPFSGQAVLELALPAQRVLRWVAKPVVVDDVTLQMATFTDITAEVQLAQLRERESYVDPLTGLANRRGFRAEVTRELARSRRAGQAPWVAVFDIDRFKSINDRHGHAAGDEVLVSVAAALRASTRGEDVLARLGGEEFVVVFAGGGDAASARAAAERMRAAVSALAPRTGPVTVSAGVARVDGDALDDALHRADALLYRAKEEGRNRVVVDA